MAKNEALDALAWLDSVLPDTPEMRAIEEEERTQITLARALRRAREAAGHTQSSLAAELGVNQSLVSRWEKVDHNHTVQTLLELARTLGANLVLGLEVNGELVPVTPAAGRAVLFSETAHEQLEHRSRERGLTLREALVQALAEDEAQVAKPAPPFSGGLRVMPAPPRYEAPPAEAIASRRDLDAYLSDDDPFKRAAVGQAS